MERSNATPSPEPASRQRKLGSLFSEHKEGGTAPTPLAYNSLADEERICVWIRLSNQTSEQERTIRGQSVA